MPVLGPAESPAPIGAWTNGVTPPGLPGLGLAQHPMLYAGENYNKMFLIKDGQVLWEHDQERAPLDVRFKDNFIQIVFKKEVQVLKYLSF